MKTKVLFFAHLREIAGSDEIFLEMDEGCKGEDILDKLEEKYPEISKHRHYLMLSMNGQYLNKEAEIIDQAEIAVFPPVSGG
ncbi:MoaD/ThiS family protein [bacterium]|nr:MoaD/ThiS family protein [bacterium]